MKKRMRSKNSGLNAIDVRHSFAVGVPSVLATRAGISKAITNFPADVLTILFT